MASLMPHGKQQYFDSNGNPLAGGRVYTYEAGTSTPLASYSDASGTAANTNPVVLNARGEASIFFGDAPYKLVVKDASDIEIYTADNLHAPIGRTELASSAAGKGASMVGFDGGSIADFFKSKSERVVDSIAALKALDTTKFTRAFVTGYYSSGDGGGGAYWHDSGDTTTADNGGTVIVGTDGGRWKLSHSGVLTVRQFGAKGDGATDDSPAFTAALAVSNEVCGSEGDTYYVAQTVTVQSARRLIGNGATIKGAAGVTSFIFSGHGSSFKGWSVDGNSGLYTIRNDGERNEFADNVFTGAVGHYLFNYGALHTRVTGNAFECEAVVGEVTTCVVFENCQQFTVTGNTFNGVPVGWGIQVRLSSQGGTISGNTFRQFKWTHSITATAAQTVFAFTLGSIVNFKGIQIDGVPLSQGYTITGSGPSYTVTFSAGRSSGEVVTLVGYRGAENIQLNTSAHDITVANNVINGTGDSGIVCLADRVAITGNVVKNAAYCGIALYGGQNNITVSSNIISDCSQLDDGLSSPENPAVASTFNGGIMVSGSQISVTGNVIVNDFGAMDYGIRINTVDNLVDGSSDAAIKIGNNVFRGSFSLGKVLMLQDTSGKRIQSIVVTDGIASPYPERVNLDGAWANLPVNTDYFTYSGFGATKSVRDTATKQGGVASLQTVAGEYVDITPTAAGLFDGCIVKVNFWAKAASGESYCSVYSTLSGALFPVTVQITDTAWREYTLTVPLSDNLTAMGPIRFGATTGSANIQHIDVSMIRI